jgi:uncharacterized membrane protein YphA (DoxX/SURF4 family)
VASLQFFTQFLGFWLLVFVRLTLGMLFLTASFSKVTDLHSFRGSVAAFGIVPVPLAPVVAIALVFLELAAGGLLLTGSHARLGALMLIVLLAAFEAALIVNLRRGRLDIECGCFGQSTSRIGWGQVLQNAGLLLGAFFVAVLDRGTPVEIGRDWLPTMAAAYTVALLLAVQERSKVHSRLTRALGSNVQTG